MAQIIQQGDPTARELNSPPESAHEADVQFYTPSARYRAIADFIDKDLVLSNLGDKERREVILIIRILLSATKLEEQKGWAAPDQARNSEISDYWLRRLVATTTTTRALKGFTANLSRTHISDERLRHDQTITGLPKGKSAMDLVKPQGVR